MVEISKRERVIETSSSPPRSPLLDFKENLVFKKREKVNCADLSTTSEAMLADVTTRRQEKKAREVVVLVGGPDPNAMDLMAEPDESETLEDIDFLNSQLSAENIKHALSMIWGKRARTPYSLLQVSFGKN
eukprot:NODE_103_length_19640_cov_0.520905.p9 type:complete len:131 gc:universal NODE_103_length_19640_cov_0.520905:2119-1727(-)